MMDFDTTTSHPDPVDFAADLAERERVAAAAYRMPVPTLAGACLNCGAKTATDPGGRVAAYCDEACSEDHARLLRARAINPG